MSFDVLESGRRTDNHVFVLKVLTYLLELVDITTWSLPMGKSAIDTTIEIQIAKTVKNSD